jgi:hypothetical protein
MSPKSGACRKAARMRSYPHERMHFSVPWKILLDVADGRSSQLVLLAGSRS